MTASATPENYTTLTDVTPTQEPEAEEPPEADAPSSDTGALPF
jgi:hypothetical protein